MWLVPQPGIEPVPPAVEAQSELLESLKKRGGGMELGLCTRLFCSQVATRKISAQTKSVVVCAEAV